MINRKFGVLSLLSFLVVLFGMAICGGDELIEPSRKLGESEKPWGGLTLFSEPPEMEVYVDGKKVGKTPVWLRQIKAAEHVLQIGGIKTSIQIKKEKTLRIGLFKGSLVRFSEVKLHVAPPETTKEKKPQHSAPRQQAEQQKKEDLTLWDRYINGSLNHF
jgi:hypothetical protein